MKFNILIKSIILLLIFSKISLAGCIDFNKDKFPSEIDFIEININNERKFLTEISRKLINFHKQDYKNFDRKRKYKSEVVVNYIDGTKCKFKARIRAHGDQADHIDLIDGTPISSLRVNLRKGNIKNITKFILFRPKSRNSDNEIFVSTLLSHLGFLSPKSFYIDVKVRGKIYKYIFQENLKKEFLERNKKIEGPIIEKNEDFWFNPQILQMTRVANKEWIKSDKSNLLSSIEAMQKYNKILMNSFNYTKNIKKDHILRYKKNSYSEEEYRKISIFDALMFALDCWHGLTFDDRRYYYDPIYSTMEPIYYDGMSRILSAIGYNVKTERYEIQLGRGLGPSALFYNETDYDPNHYTNYVSDSAINGSALAIEKINNINKDKFIAELKNNGLKKINKEKLDILFKFIIERINLIKNANISKFDDPLEGEIFTKYSKNMQGLDEKKHLVFLNEILKNEENYLFNVEICTYNLKNCEIYTTSESEIKLLLEQKKFKNKYSIFLALNKNNYIAENLNIENNIFSKKYELLKFTDNLNLAITDNIKVSFNEESRNLSIDFYNNDARVIIYKSYLDNLTINMKNLSKEKNIFSKKINGLTGCLTIIDSKLKNISVNGSNFNCEDTLNFIRSEGEINNINIKNSISDGVDADFSNLNIYNLSVQKTINDCSDFSYGKYNIKFSELINCGDKAVSIGEKSEMKLDNLIVLDSNTGVASKDSSNTKVINSTIIGVRECFAAYNKKQEFGGGSISIGSSSCTNFYNKKVVDKYSLIEIEKEQ